VPAGRYPVWATATDRGGNSTLLGLPWVRVGADESPPAVRVVLRGTELEWRASDAKSPWFKARLERMVSGKLRKRNLGRFDRRGAFRLRTPPLQMGTTTLVIADTSGNVARIPLCATPS
jgi:hypothetical protein